MSLKHRWSLKYVGMNYSLNYRFDRTIAGPDTHDTVAVFIKIRSDVSGGFFKERFHCTGTGKVVLLSVGCHTQNMALAQSRHGCGDSPFLSHCAVPIYLPVRYSGC